MILIGCDDLIQYSPYQTKYDGEKDLTVKNIGKLSKKSSSEFKPFQIAFITDTHTEYDEFEDAVSFINKMDSVDFVLHGGDLTLSSLYKEFEWCHDIIQGFEKPYFTVIGNHDYLSNGGYVYKEMFGEPNYTFVFNNVKFVMFDDVVWEKSMEDPDFDWFRKEITNNKNYTHVIPLSHIPPWDEQMNYGNELAFNFIMEEAGIKLSLHGHVHGFHREYRYNPNGVEYLTSDDIKDRNFLLLKVEKDTVKHEIIYF